jgi:hypothetical protein
VRSARTFLTNGGAASTVAGVWPREGTTATHRKPRVTSVVTAVTMTRVAVCSVDLRRLGIAHENKARPRSDKPSL